MSNLLKFNTVYCEGDKKVIDYNALIEEKLSEIAKKMEQSFDNSANPEAEGNDFMAGLTAEKVERLLDEESEAEPEISNEEILAQANEEAEKILAQAREVAENLKQQAYQEGRKQGYDDGYAQAVSDVENLKIEVENHRQELEDEYQRQLDEMEPLLVDTITNVVQRVFKIKFEDNKNMIVHLLRNAIGQIENSKEYLIKVSKIDYPYVVKYKEVLEKSVVQAASIAVTEDVTLEKGQCMIETDGGVFDCSMDTQLDGLIKALKILSLN